VVLRAEHGFAVEAGQPVITGSILPGMATDGFRAFTANFAGIGSVAVELD
jgi:2-keto-4-pentenoate hydratase